MKIDYFKLLKLVQQLPSEKRICMIPVLLTLKEKGFVTIKGVTYFC